MPFPSYQKYNICVNVEKHDDKKIRTFDKILCKDIRRCTECNSQLRVSSRKKGSKKRGGMY